VLDKKGEWLTIAELPLGPKYIIELAKPSTDLLLESSGPPPSKEWKLTWPNPKSKSETIKENIFRFQIVQGNKLQASCPQVMIRSDDFIDRVRLSVLRITCVENKMQAPLLLALTPQLPQIQVFDFSQKDSPKTHSQDVREILQAVTHLQEDKESSLGFSLRITNFSLSILQPAPTVWPMVNNSISKAKEPLRAGFQTKLAEPFKELEVAIAYELKQSTRSKPRPKSKRSWALTVDMDIEAVPAASKTAVNTTPGPQGKSSEEVIHEMEDRLVLQELVWRYGRIDADLVMTEGDKEVVLLRFGGEAQKQSEKQP